MAQLVRMPVAQARPLAQPDEGVREVVRVHRRPDLASEDQPVILPQRPGRHLRLGLPRPVLPEPGYQLGSKRQDPPRFRRLQLTDHQAGPAIRGGVTVLDPLHAVCHSQRASLPVQSRPVQAQDLTAAHPVSESQHNRRLERYPVAASRSCRACSTVSVRPSLALMRGAADNPATAHDALAHGLPECPAQHRPHDPDTIGAVTRIPFRLPQPVKISDGQLGRRLRPSAGMRCRRTVSA